MSEYAKMKNADLEALLKSRGLQGGGKKAEMVERLTKDDEDKKGTESSDPSSKPAALHPEDEIDWDDDVEDTPANASKPATAPAASIPEVSEGQVDKPQAVANQAPAIDPSQTADLSVDLPVQDKETVEEAKPEEQSAPPPDYTRGLAATNLDQEIEKRKARAKKFGLNIEEDEGLKKLERAKKFGEAGVPKGLDEALPEGRKRGREDGHDSGRNKRRGGGGFGGRRGGRGDRGGDRRNQNRDGRTERPHNGGTGWMNDNDRAKAEARKNKWATPASS